MWTLLVLVLTSVLCVPGAKEETYDIREYLNDLNGKVPTTEDQQVTKVKRLWGVPDTTASVGRIFTYVIPEDAFSGEIERYVVTEAGEPSLPNWLYFEPETHTFRGVPTEHDAGRVYISVKAVAKSSTEDDPPVAKDVFSIEVTDDSSYSTSRGQCPHRAVLTVMTVITDANMADLPSYRRYDLVIKMATALKLDPQEVKLGTLGGEAYDDQALAAGPGNAKTRDGAGVTLKWMVGCEGAIRDTETVASVEKLSKNSKLSADLGLPVVGWHVTNQQPPVQIRIKRMNRAVHGTPVPDIVPTMWSSEIIDDIEPTDDSVVPESRVIPTMSSPIYTMSSHRHRHHHSLTDRGHHNHHIVPSTPVFSLYSTPFVVPVLPSEHIQSSIYFPEESMESSSTPVIYETEPVPSATPMVTSDITPTRSYPVVEPSKQPIPNFKPNVPNRLKKLSLVAGKFWTYRIPEDTFFDVEEGNTRNLKLMFLTHHKETISSNSWIQFDPEKQELYALPFIENIGVHEFKLEAMDSEGATIIDDINVRVWDYSTAHPSHTFTMKLKYQKWQYPVGIDWQIEVLKRIAEFNGDRDTSSIMVRSVTLDPATIIWSNETLEDRTCHREAILELFNRLATNTSAPNPALRKIMKPEFKVLDIEIGLSGMCLDKFHTPSPPSLPTPAINAIPVLRNPIDYINTTVGDVLQFIVPKDTFYDKEDGGTRNLTLTLLTIGSQNLERSSWIQFDQRRQLIQAMPEKGNLGEHIYQIVASDSKGEEVVDVFKISVKALKKEKMVIEFNIKIREDYNSFQQDTMKKLLLTKKIARIYGDVDASHMRITNISEGSVIYAWTNKSLPVDRCPKRKITHLVRQLINDNEKANPKFINELQPEFQVEKIWVMPLSHCLDEGIPTPHVVLVPAIVTTPEPGTTMKPATTTSDDDIYITTVIPAVVIAIMLIIAAMVACFLYRKKRKGKMTMQDTSGFMSKGVPIIFADEIDEKPDPAKPPVIMKDEKPPLSQPTYQQTESEEPTPQIDRREPQSDPPYQPPPPFTATREAKNGRPKATPTYRQPPPYYVPP